MVLAGSFVGNGEKAEGKKKQRRNGQVDRRPRAKERYAAQKAAVGRYIQSVGTAVARGWFPTPPPREAGFSCSRCKERPPHRDSAKVDGASKYQKALRVRTLSEETIINSGCKATSSCCAHGPHLSLFVNLQFAPFGLPTPITSPRPPPLPSPPFPPAAPFLLVSK